MRPRHPHYNLLAYYTLKTPCSHAYAITIFPTILLPCWIIAAIACAFLALVNPPKGDAAIAGAVGFCIECFVERLSDLPR